MGSPRLTVTLKQSESLRGPEEPRVFHRKSIQLPLVLDSVTPAMWPWVFYVCSTFSIGHLTWLTYPANNWHLFKISEHEHRHFREATIDTFIIWIWSPGVLACTFEALMDPKVQNKIQNLDYKGAGRWLDPTCFPRLGLAESWDLGQVFSILLSLTHTNTNSRMQLVPWALEINSHWLRVVTQSPGVGGRGTNVYVVIQRSENRPSFVTPDPTYPSRVPPFSSSRSFIFFFSGLRECAEGWLW